MRTVALASRQFNSNRNHVAAPLFSLVGPRRTIGERGSPIQTLTLRAVELFTAGAAALVEPDPTKNFREQTPAV